MKIQPFKRPVSKAEEIELFLSLIEINHQYVFNLRNDGHVFGTVSKKVTKPDMIDDEELSDEPYVSVLEKYTNNLIKIYISDISDFYKTL